MPKKYWNKINQFINNPDDYDHEQKKETLAHLFKNQGKEKLFMLAKLKTKRQAFAMATQLSRLKKVYSSSNKDSPM